MQVTADPTVMLDDHAFCHDLPVNVAAIHSEFVKVVRAVTEDLEGLIKS